MAVGTRIQLRRDTAANWTSNNPVLAQGEPGLETDTGFEKIGDGSTVWTSLAYSRSTPDIAGVLSAWKPLGYDRPFAVGGGVAAQTSLVYPGGGILLNAAASGYCAFRLDPTWFAVGTHTTNVRVVASLAVNAVAPNVNFTFALSSVATWGGASGTRTIVATLNTALCSVTQNTPAASTQYALLSSAAALTAGYYVLSVVNSGTTATGSDIEGHLSVQCQQV